MRVSEIMTEKVLKVRMDDSLETIREILENVGFHHLLVVEKERLVGVISDRDVFKSWVSALQASVEGGFQLSGLENKKAHQIMTRHPITIDKSMTINTAINMMLKNRISCLPVLSPDGEIEGILTMRDILKAMAGMK